MNTSRVPWGAYACLSSCMALVGSYVGLSKLLLMVFPVFLLAWLRFGIAAVVMLPWLKPTAADVVPVPRPMRVLLFWQSFLGNFLFSICMLYGVLLTSALAAGVVMAAIPAAVALLSRALLGERIAPRVKLAIPLAMAGIALLALARTPQGDGPDVTSVAAPAASIWGYALLLAAVVCEACYVVIGKKLTGSVSPRRISAFINLWGLALVTPLGLWQAWTFDFAAVGISTWALLLFYAIAASVVTVWLWMKGLTHVPSSQAGVFAVMLPISAAAIGVLVLGETATAVHGIALVLALVGLLLATWPQRGAAQ
jgi:drug/metabolite transporter (DMT)-like permease